MTEPTPAPGNSTAAEHTPASAVDSPLTTGATPDSGPVTAAAGGASDADSATATGEKVESHGHQEDEEADDDRPLGQRLAYEAAERRMREESLQTYVHGSSHHIVGGALFETHGGDINVGLERSETIKRHLVGEQLAREIENTFVPTSSYNKLVSQLAVEQVVVLKGHESSGRFWTALAALAQWAAERPGLRRHGWLQGVHDPRRIDARRLDEHTGYVLGATNAEWTRHGRNEVIRHLQSVADTLQGRFVVLTGPDGLPGYPAVAHDAPNPRAVFESRLIWHLRQRGRPCPQSLLQALAHIASEDRPPGESDFLAREAAGVLAEGGRVEDFTSGLPDALRDLARSLLSQEDTTLHQRCFLISLAVLNELPLVTVSRAAALLLEMLAPPNPAPDTTASPSWEWLPAWLEAAQAERSVRDSVTRVRLRRPRLAGAILEVVWEEGESIREAVLAWLKLLAQRRDRRHWEVRVKVAHAIGRIAAFDFKLIEAEFLDEWSRSQRQYESWLASWALEAAYAAKPSPQVLDCLARWVRTASTRRTAARAYGSLIGRERIGEALKAFRYMVARSLRWNRYLHDSVGRALTEVYTPTTAPEILEELADWSGEEHAGLRRVAALALTRLAMRKDDEGDRLQIDDLDAESWLAAEEQLATAWINALTCGLSSAALECGVTPPVPEAWDAFGSWVAAWDDLSQRYRIVIERVFERSTATLHGPLRLYLCHWYQTGAADADLCKHLHTRMKGGTT